MKSESEIYVEAEIYAKAEKEKRLFGQRVSRCMSTEEFQLEAYTAGFLKCQKEYEDKNLWIPVTEKLPEEKYINVLMKDSSNSIRVGFFGGARKPICRVTENYIENVTHWRFL